MCAISVQNSLEPFSDFGLDLRKTHTHTQTDKDLSATLLAFKVCLGQEDFSR